MKILKRSLLLLGAMLVVSTLIFAVQKNTDQSDKKPLNVSVDSAIADKRVADGYRISAIEIPEDLNFAGRTGSSKRSRNIRAY